MHIRAHDGDVLVANHDSDGMIVVNTMSHSHDNVMVVVKVIMTVDLVET